METNDTNIISVSDWAKVEIKIGEIKSAEKIPDTDKLLRLQVNFGKEERQIVSGITTFFPEPESLIGKRCAFITNLESRMLRGYESQGMILAAKSGDGLSLLEVEASIEPGTKIS